MRIGKCIQNSEHVVFFAFFFGYFGFHICVELTQTKISLHSYVSEKNDPDYFSYREFRFHVRFAPRQSI